MKKRSHALIFLVKQTGYIFFKKNWAKKYKRPEPKVNPMTEIIVPIYVPKIIPAKMAIGELNPRKKAQKNKLGKQTVLLVGKNLVHIDCMSLW